MTLEKSNRHCVGKRDVGKEYGGAQSGSAGLTVTHALVIVDRNEQDGRQTVEAQGLTVLNLLTVDDLIRQQPAKV